VHVFAIFSVICESCQIAARAAENARSPRPKAFPPVPRPLRWRRFPFWSFVILVPISGALVTAFVYLIVPILLKACAAPLGETVAGKISEKSVYHGKKGTPRYQITYTYQVEESNFASTMQVDEHVYQRINVGDRAQIRLLRFAPIASAYLTSPAVNESLDASCALSFSGLASLFTVWAFYSEFVKHRRRREVVRNGIAVVGHITEKQIYKGRTSQYVLTYRYRLPKGAFDRNTKRIDHEDKTWVSEHDYEASRVGEEVTVLYDPIHPKRSILYRFAEYAIVGLD
jgi:hypothetical protein